jgi:crotonobetainyl-CoA:carnitine CoA-transferase CaiB-like acyl-CoA transferase
MPPIFTGLRVLDLSQNLAGAVAGMILSDHGAEILKVEPPAGNPVRDLAGWLVWGRGARSVVLDLNQPAGRDVLVNLLTSSDVLLESFTPGVMAAWGLDYASLRARFPRLVYCAISGYGQTGRDHDRPGRGELVEARLGLQYEQPGYRDGPIYLGWPLAEYGGAFLTAIGLVTALYVRAVSGKGQQVDSSLANGAAFLVGTRWAWGEQTNLTEARSRDPAPRGGMGNRRVVIGLFQCQDASWVQIHTAPRGGFNRLMRAVGLDELADPSRDNENQPSTMPDEMARQMWRDLERIFRSKPRDEWVAILKRADLPVMPAKPPGESFDNEQILANDLVVELEDPTYGVLREIGIAQKFARTPGRVAGPAPRLGEHTDEILASAGYQSAALSALRRQGVIG